MGHLQSGNMVDLRKRIKLWLSGEDYVRERGRRLKKNGMGVVIGQGARHVRADVNAARRQFLRDVVSVQVGDGNESSLLMLPMDASEFKDGYAPHGASYVKTMVSTASALRRSLPRRLSNATARPCAAVMDAVAAFHCAATCRGGT